MKNTLGHARCAVKLTQTTASAAFAKSQRELGLAGGNFMGCYVAKKAVRPNYRPASRPAKTDPPVWVKAIASPVFTRKIAGMDATPSIRSNRGTATVVVIGILAVAALIAAVVMWNKGKDANAAVAKTQGELASARTEAGDLKKQLDAARAESANYQKQLEEAKSGVSRLETAMADANTSAAKLKDQLAQAKAASARAKEQFDKEIARSAAALETQGNTRAQAAESQAIADRLKKELDEAKSRSAQFQKQVDAANAQLAELQTKLDASQAQIAALQPRSRANPHGHVLLLEKYPDSK